MIIYSKIFLSKFNKIERSLKGETSSELICSINLSEGQDSFYRKKFRYVCMSLITSLDSTIVSK